MSHFCATVDVMRRLRRGLRTGIYGGPVVQVIAIVTMVLALFVAGGLKSGYITTGELRADPVGTVQRMVEPTAADIAAKVQRLFG